jgi:hypothetical protein
MSRAIVYLFFSLSFFLFYRQVCLAIRPDDRFERLIAYRLKSNVTCRRRAMYGVNCKQGCTNVCRSRDEKERERERAHHVG